MSITVFLNGQPMQAHSGDTLGMLLAEHDPELLKAVIERRAIATDGRAIAVTADAPLTAGSIFLVRLSARAVQEHTYA